MGQKDPRAAADIMSTKDASNRPNAEIITPLSVPKKDMGIGPDRLQRRHQFTTVILIGCITILVAAGAWLLHFLSKNPHQPQPVTAKKPQKQPNPAIQSEPAPEAPLPPTADPQKLALNKRQRKN